MTCKPDVNCDISQLCYVSGSSQVLRCISIFLIMLLNIPGKLPQDCVKVHPWVDASSHPHSSTYKLFLSHAYKHIQAIISVLKNEKDPIGNMIIVV